jgi:hypothetical protein
MFQEREATRILSSKLQHYGALNISLNNKVQSASEVELLDAPDDFQTWIEQGEDSLRLWFDGTMPDTGKWSFVIRNPVEELNDTIQVKAKARSEFVEKADNLIWYQKRKKSAPKSRRSGKRTVRVSLPLQDTATMLQSPFETMGLYFSRAIVTIDTNQILLLKDSSISVVRLDITETVDSLTQDVRLDTAYKTVLQDTFLPITKSSIKVQNNLALTYPWEAAARYKLVILPNGVTDYLGLMNQDTLSRIYAIDKVDNYGTVTVVITEADSSLQYVVQLLDSKNNLIEEAIVQDSTQMTFVYKNIPTNTYVVRVVHDEFPNGRWDVGSYDKNRQAELTTTTKLIKLKPGWENKMELSLNPDVSSNRSTSKGKGKGKMGNFEEEDEGGAKKGKGANKRRKK